MGKAVDIVKDRTALLSIHHISPVFEDDVVKTYDLLCDLGISDYTLLVAPMYLMKRSNTFSGESMFTQFLQSLRLEIGQHGYSHTTKSGSPDEFTKLTKDQVSKRLKGGRALIRKGFGVAPKGFVPPLWAAPPLISKVASDLGFSYCIRENTIDSFADGRSLSVAARVISEGGRRLPTVDAMLEVQLGGALQVGIHPLDHAKNDMFEFLADLKDNKGYHFLSYSRYLLGPE